MANLEDMQENCEECGTELEIGQIGECDDCQHEHADDLYDDSPSM